MQRLFALTIFFISTVAVFAQAPLQEQASWSGRSRYPDGVLALKAGSGLSKYMGQFLDHTTASHYGVTAQYSVFPELSVGASALWGDLSYIRRDKRGLSSLYDFQFGSENMVPRSTWFSNFNIDFMLHFFPRSVLDAYVLAGAGVTMYYPDDYAQSKTTLPSKFDKLAAVSFPVGIGTDLFLMRKLALNAEFRINFLMADNLDAFPTDDLMRAYRQGSGVLPTGESTPSASDAFSTLTFGIKYFLFENSDLDGDLLPNALEEQIGTNPYDQDTDGDGLSDYEEYATYHTDPKLKDTDADGLNDYVEVIKYRSNPLLADTDGDGLSDFREVTEYKTTVSEKDTDADGIGDGEEVALGTNPREVDTDRDDLSDGEEVRTWHTNPLLADTDGDGLSDFEEVKTYQTNPLTADTDKDGLNDYEELVVLRSNPLVKDTDRDGLEDYAEARVTGTNLLNRDSDGDGVPDAVDKCPMLAGVDSPDGCPHSTAPHGFASAQTAAATQARPSDPAFAMQLATNRMADTVQRTDTVVVREGGVFTLFGVNFEVDKAVLRAESIPILELNARLFSMYPEMQVEIRGHTDSDGDERHNEELSLRRAQTVRDFLIEHGIPRERLTVRGFGESSPVVSNASELGKARNRRIEFYIVHRGPRLNDRQLITGDPNLFE